MAGNLDKVTANSGLAGACVVVLLFGIGLIFPSVDVPGEVGAALVLITSGIIGYLTKPNDGQPGDSGNSYLNGEG